MKIYEQITNLIGPAYGIFFSLVLAAAFVACTFLSFPFPLNANLYWCFFLSAIILGLILLILYFVVRRTRLWQILNSNKLYWILIIVFCVLFVCYSIIMMIDIEYINPDDAYDLTFGCFLSADEYVYEYSFWFNNLPDRLFLGGLFIRFYWFMKFINIDVIFSNLFNIQLTDTLLSYICWYFVIFGSILLVMFSVVFLAVSVKNIISNRAGLLAFFFGLFLLGLNPIILTPYSDTYSVFFVSLILWALTGKSRPLIKCPIIVFSSIIAFYIKPTNIFFLLAIIIVKLPHIVIYIKTTFVNKYNLKVVVLSVITAILTFTFVFCIQDFGIDKNNEKQFTWTHFLTIGMNNSTTGYWSPDKVEISESCDTIHEREAANLQNVKEEITEMGPIGLFNLCVRKTIRNFNDGSFSFAYWNWTASNNPRIETKLLWYEVIKPFYGISDFATNDQSNTNTSEMYDLNVNCPFNLLSETLWILMLLFSIFASVFKQKSSNTKVLCVTCLFVALFLIIFEANSRYVYMFSPVFIYLAFIGFNEISKRLYEGVKCKTTNHLTF